MRNFIVRVFRNGQPVQGIRIAGGINHGIYAGQTEVYYTNANGFAIIEWYQDTYLDTIFIGYEGKRGHFDNGGMQELFI